MCEHRTIIGSMGDRSTVAKRSRRWDGLPFGVAVAMTLALAGCDTPRPPAPASPQAANQPASKATIQLDPGCPLGATALLGLNIAEESCRPSIRTLPAGPPGSPNIP